MSPLVVMMMAAEHWDCEERERFHKGELDRGGYVEAMIEQALGSLWPLTRGDVELVRRTLRCLIEIDPALAELVDRATSARADSLD